MPLYVKPSVAKRRRRPGARPGHEGTRRPQPEHIDRREEHRVDVCPCCGGPVQRCNRTRTRIIIDIPADIATEAVEHTIHRDYCSACKKHVEPVVPDALPNATLGHRVKGAVTQAVFMSIYRTLRLRGHDPMTTIAHALRTGLLPGQLPPLPVESVADG